MKGHATQGKSVDAVPTRRHTAENSGMASSPRLRFRTPQASFIKGELNVPLCTHALPCKTYMDWELIGFGIHNSFGVVRIQP